MSESKALIVYCEKFNKNLQNIFFRKNYSSLKLLYSTILVKEKFESVQLPDEFDSRVKWGEICPSTKEVRDQGNCGSCWVSQIF